MKGWLKKENLRGKYILTLFIATSLLYLYMLLVTIPAVTAFSNGMALLDMMPGGYSLRYVNELLTVLGPQGRSAYMTKQIPVDMFYPAFFAVTYSMVFAYFLNKAGKLPSKWSIISYLPIVAGVCDYMENILFLRIVKSYPALSAHMVTVANIFSIGKSSATTIYFCSLIILITYFVAVSVKARKGAIK